MTYWNPTTLCECVGSDVLGWLTGILAVGMLLWYVAIAMRWNEARQHASKGGKAVWGWLIVIFIVCANAGYVALTLALWMPKTSVWLRIAALAAQNVACPFFWFLAQRYKFHLIGDFERIGETIFDAVGRMNDKELATHARNVVAMSIGRTADKLTSA